MSSLALGTVIAAVGFVGTTGLVITQTLSNSSDQDTSEEDVSEEEGVPLTPKVKIAVEKKESAQEVGGKEAKDEEIGLNTRPKVVRIFREPHYTSRNKLYYFQISPSAGTSSLDKYKPHFINSIDKECENKSKITYC